MKNVQTLLKLIGCSILAALTLDMGNANAQACTPQGDQVTYGTNNVWKAYVYQGKNFDTYKGYATEGNSSSPSFDESFGGTQVTYNTNGCGVTTDNFSVRYKLTKTITSGNYQITVGGDDGYRFSLDGGSTWLINKWNDQSYTTTSVSLALNGTYNMVIEYYENAGSNRVSFDLTALCTGTGNPATSGSNNVWNGYVYQGMNFDMYKGQVTEGSTASANFDENFGNTSNSNTTVYNTNSCSIYTYQFSARYRLTTTLPSAHYTFTLGGDDGIRLSLDGGATWVINKWLDQPYAVYSYTANLSGTYNMVIEYYQNGGATRVSFAMTSTTLPVSLVTWSVSALAADQALLKWQATNAVNFDHYTIQRSTDGASFQDIHTIPTAVSGNSAVLNYAYTDQYAYNGTLYYRLAMVDLDGSINYSNIISLNLHNNQDIRIYPTLIENGSLFVESSQSIPSARLELFDMNGNRINEKIFATLLGRQQVSIKTGSSASLPAGAYIARLSDSHSILAKQIIIVK